MPNGKPGDSPYTDVVIHDREVYSPEIDDLIRELDALGAAIAVHDVPGEDELDALAADLRELKRERDSDD